MASTLKINTIQHTGGTTGLTIDSSGKLLIVIKLYTKIVPNGDDNHISGSWIHQ